MFIVSEGHSHVKNGSNVPHNLGQNTQESSQQRLSWEPPRSVALQVA